MKERQNCCSFMDLVHGGRWNIKLMSKSLDYQLSHFLFSFFVKICHPSYCFLAKIKAGKVLAQSLFLFTFPNDPKEMGGDKKCFDTPIRA